MKINTTKIYFLEKGSHKDTWMSVWNIKMLYYDRIDASEGIDVNKSSASK